MRNPTDLPAQRISKTEFAELMAAVGPFEKNPEIAVACSGGADSTALAVLTDAWARARGGKATALVVDHGIRTNSATEAGSVATELGKQGIACTVLRNKSPIGSGDVQAAARKVRYELLQDWCKANGYLHLAVAHHREDQAETVLLRLARGSGSDGLAAMAPVSETSAIRIVRPLLSVPRAAVRATLAQVNVKHVEDPSNSDTKFARVRMRVLSSTLAKEGLTVRRLAETASRMARTRNALEDDVAIALARAATVYSYGHSRVLLEPLRRLPEETALRALARLLICIGGNQYTPRLARIERLYAWIQDGAPGGGRTLAGCRVLPRSHGLLVCREVSAATSVLPAKGEVLWDGRFRLYFGPRRVGEIKRLGNEGWRQVTAIDPALKKSNIPAVVRAGLPAIWRNGTLRSVPHLGLLGNKTVPHSRHPHYVEFAPLHPLVPARFTLQKGRYTLSK